MGNKWGKWIGLLTAVLVVFSTGCSAQDKEATSQLKTEKKVEKERIKQEKEEQKQKESLDDEINKIVKKAVDKKNIVAVEINDNLGTENPNDKIVLLKLKAKESITKNMSKKGMWMDTKQMLEAFAKKQEITQVVWFWEAPLTDASGNKEQGTIMKITYDRQAIDKIDFKHFVYKDVPTTATEYWQHQALEKK
ncbi:hypothetical protein V7183_10865 [Bacillus sp. JJ1127]|uniref:hypothetical protein n=1 Tax=Bacillus sp. JJ1127 TaxID=3122952 RepID=UPI003000AAF1